MTVRGVVRGLADYYADKVERLEIHVAKAAGQGLPAEVGQRMPITLVIDGRSYRAGLRSTADCDYLWISPNLVDADGNDTKLAYVLPAAGFVKNQQVELEVCGRVVTVNKAGREG